MRKDGRRRSGGRGRRRSGRRDLATLLFDASCDVGEDAEDCIADLIRQLGLVATLDHLSRLGIWSREAGEGDKEERVMSPPASLSLSQGDAGELTRQLTTY